MPSAVLELEFTQLPDELTGLDRYQKAFILLKYADYPVAKLWLPVYQGTVSRAQLEDAILKHCGEAFWQRWAEDYFQINEKHPPKISLATTVAICTRDRPEDLRTCLQGLMQLPDDGQEILVIDNCPSSDATARVVADFPRARYVLEKRRGLDVARNRALREARGEIVAFIDDDARPDPRWLRALLANFVDPQVMCVTGLTMPMELETEAQELFEHYGGFSRGFQRREFARLTFNPLFGGQVGAGANMALRRSVIEQVGLFDEALDAGTATHSGGDADMCSQILRCGYKIIYEPAALNWHRHRRSLPELHKVIYGYGVGVYAMLTKEFLLNRRVGVVRVMWGWLRYGQLPGLFKALLTPSASPLPAAFYWDELRGCLAGPKAYLRARRELRAQVNGEAA
ncbi:MAG: glycosyltransferase [Chloroflexi bacterium]|nr:glycosyltransferase [Chloroflexota bacterium]